MSAGRIDRRRFLQAGLGAGAVLAVAGMRPWRVLIESTRAPLAERLTALLEHRASAGVVGGEYLRNAAGEKTEGALLEGLVSGISGGRRAAERASGAELGELVAAAVERDFAEEDTVRLQGWIVSRTEARLCALAAQDPAGPEPSRRS